MPKRPKPRPQPKSFLRNWVLPLLVAIAVLTPLRSAIADWNDVPTGSMRPTILEGDRIFVNKLTFGLRIPFTHTWVARWDTPETGEIITLASPEDGTRLVKRVIASAGQTVAMQNNQLLIDGAASALTLSSEDRRYIKEVGRSFRVSTLDESFGGATHTITLSPDVSTNSSFPEFAVPEGHIFVMGDNRSFSKDSRMFGCVPVAHVYGCATHVAISVDPDNSYLPRLGRFFKKLN